MVAGKVSKAESTYFKFIFRPGGMISKSCRLKNYNLKHKKPHVFSQCQWQKTADVSNWYLVYRAFHVVACLLMFVASGGDPAGIRHKDPVSFYLKWPIYFTHWGIVICVVQSLMALTLVSHRKHADRKTRGNTLERSNANQQPMNLFTKTYWVLHTTAVDSALIITMTYWIFVFNPEEGLNLPTVMSHIVNSVLMLIDIFLVAHPVRLLHMHWPMLFIVIYLFFSWCYYMAGGLSRKLEPFMYAIMDWRKPGVSLGFCACILAAFVLIHTSVFLLSLLRRLVYIRLVKPPKPDPVQASLLSIANEAGFSDVVL